MSESCFTEYTLLCEDEAEATKVCQTITKWLSISPPNGINFIAPWVGLFPLGSGVATWNGEGFTPEYKCAGEVVKMPEVSENRVVFHTEWKYASTEETIADSINHVFPSVTVLYSAVHESNEFLLTNDASIMDNVVIDVWGHEESEFWELASKYSGLSEHELREELQWLENAGWYVVDDMDSVATLASTLLTEEVEDPVEALNHAYSSFLKISQWEYEDIKKSSVFN